MTRERREEMKLVINSDIYLFKRNEGRIFYLLTEMKYSSIMMLFYFREAVLYSTLKLAEVVLFIIHREEHMTYMYSFYKLSDCSICSGSEKWNIVNGWCWYRGYILKREERKVEMTILMKAYSIICGEEAEEEERLSAAGRREEGLEENEEKSLHLILKEEKWSRREAERKTEIKQREGRGREIFCLWLSEGSLEKYRWRNEVYLSATAILKLEEKLLCYSRNTARSLCNVSYLFRNNEREELFWCRSMCSWWPSEEERNSL